MGCGEEKCLCGSVFQHMNGYKSHLYLDLTVSFHVISSSDNTIQT